MLFGKSRFKFLTMVALYYKCVPAAAVYRTIIMLTNALTPTLSIIVTAMFLDSAIAAVSDRALLSQAYVPLALLIVLGLYGYYMNVVSNLVMRRADNRLLKLVVPEIAQRKARLKFKYYENQETLDIMNRAVDGFEGKINEFCGRAVEIVTLVMQVAGFLAILGAQLWWASLVFIAASVPSFIIAHIFGKKRYDTEKELTKIDRRVGYFTGMLTGRDTVEERYIYGYTGKINQEYRQKYEEARILRKNVNKKMWISNKTMSLLTFASGIIVIVILLPSAIFPNEAGELALSSGMFMALVSAILNMSGTLQWSVSNIIGDLKYKAEYLKDLNKFLEFEEEAGADCLPDADAPVLESIEFRNVSFKYPGAEPYILKDFSLKLVAGKHYAIVGVNGAGKTTLTKILTRLYDNYEGEILINGRELRRYSQGELKALAQVVYQDFCRYPLDFYNNIAIGNVLDMQNRERVENAVKTIGLTDVVEKLPRKYETPITKIKEDGVDLSGGEWQRIALARLIVNSAPLKILDEPTAALDPIGESRVYEQFGEIISHNQKSKTQGITIFISHRLGSTKLADEIVVISEGRVEEQGTFGELMRRGGLYAQMFESQAEWYRDDKAGEEGA